MKSHKQTGLAFAELEIEQLSKHIFFIMSEPIAELQLKSKFSQCLYLRSLRRHFSRLYYMCLHTKEYVCSRDIFRSLEVETEENYLF